MDADTTTTKNQIMMSRAERRLAAKVAKHKSQRNVKSRCGTLVDKWLWEAGKDSSKKAFAKLKQEADINCIASENVQQIVCDVGFLLYVVLRGMELDQLEADQETTHSLEAMKVVLCDAQETQAMSAEQRKVLMDGMDYLVTLSEYLTDEAAAVAWAHVSRVTGIKR